MRLPLLLLLIVIFSLVFHVYIPISVQSFLYALSLSVKELLLFFIPFFVFFFIFNSVVKLQGNAVKLFSLIVAMVCISNFFSTWIAYGVTKVFEQTLENISFYQDNQITEELKPFWHFSLPRLISNDLSVITALIIGLLIAFLIPKVGNKIARISEKGIEFFLNKALLPLIPLFIVGFMLKLAHDQVLLSMIHYYFVVLLIVFSGSASYILVWHLIILRFTGVCGAIKNLFPSIVTGFSSMSSVVAMPLLIKAVEKNIKDQKVVRAVIPSVTNFHLVGDCFAIPIFAISILATFSYPALSLSQYLIFSAYFVVAKFAVAAVPGGGILVMLPILKSTLGFDDAMLSLITTLYIMFDGVITSVNIFGNSALSMLITKTYNYSNRGVETKA